MTYSKKQKKASRMMMANRRKFRAHGEKQNTRTQMRALASQIDKAQRSGPRKTGE